ncbi:hypothetical protein BDN67DRAFT_781507 [Paxillus ammoniavirescens]|nr:hypothetical protein BDN67DRAFT_781507 [Paxillus ammoniavirescens]
MTLTTGYLLPPPCLLPISPAHGYTSPRVSHVSIASSALSLQPRYLGRPTNAERVHQAFGESGVGESHGKMLEPATGARLLLLSVPIDTLLDDTGRTWT